MFNKDRFHKQLPYVSSIQVMASPNLNMGAVLWECAVQWIKLGIGGPKIGFRAINMGASGIRTYGRISQNMGSGACVWKCTVQWVKLGAKGSESESEFVQAVGMGNGQGHGSSSLCMGASESGSSNSRWVWDHLASLNVYSIGFSSYSTPSPVSNSLS